MVLRGWWKFEYEIKLQIFGELKKIDFELQRKSFSGKVIKFRCRSIECWPKKHLVSARKFVESHAMEITHNFHEIFACLEAKTATWSKFSSTESTSLDLKTKSIRNLSMMDEIAESKNQNRLMLSWRKRKSSNRKLKLLGGDGKRQNSKQRIIVVVCEFSVSLKYPRELFIFRRRRMFAIMYEGKHSVDSNFARFIC